MNIKSLYCHCFHHELISVGISIFGAVFHVKTWHFSFALKSVGKLMFCEFIESDGLGITLYVIKMNKINNWLNSWTNTQVLTSLPIFKKRKEISVYLLKELISSKTCMLLQTCNLFWKIWNHSIIQSGLQLHQN